MNQEETIRLIQSYKEHSFLWDPKDKAFHNRAKRDNAWKEMSVVFNFPVSDLKSKMKTLMGSYRSLRSKENRSRAARSGEDVFEPKWFAYKYFDFLNDKETFIATRDTFKNEPQEEPAMEYPPVHCILEGQNDEIDENSQTQMRFDDEPSRPAWGEATQKRKKLTDTVTTSKKMRRSKTVDPWSNAGGIVNEIPKTPAENGKDPDHFDHFGTYIASLMRQLPEDRSTYLQAEILKSITLVLKPNNQDKLVSNVSFDGSTKTEE